ncbi:T9SS type A sorting domain-containing protein [Flavobacterium hauense]
MKQFYIMAAALILTAGTANAQENLIINGNFENWTAANPENFGIQGTAETVLYNDLIVKETTTVRTGNSVKQQSKEQGSTQYLEYGNLIAVEAGKSYTVSYWYYDNDNKARTRLYSTWLDAQNQKLPDNVQSLYDATYSTDSAEWVNKTKTVTAPAGAVKLRYQIRAYSQGTASGGFIYYDDLSLIENGVAGTDENAIEGLLMFPNPVSGNILNITSSNNAEKAVAIYDMLGKQVVAATVSNGTVNVENLSTGLYIVKITEEGKTATKKLIKK